MAAPTYGAAATPVVNSTVGASTVFNTGLPVRTENDLLCVIISRAVVTATITPPTGFRLAQNINHNGGDLAFFVKVITASEPSTYTFSWTGNTRNYGQMFTVTGTPDPSNTLAAEPTGASNTTGTTPDPPASGTVASGDYLAIAVGGQEGKAATRISAGTPSGYTLREDDGSTGAGSGATHDSAFFSTLELTTITSEDPGTFTSSTSDGWGALTFLVASGPGPQTLSGVLFSKAPVFIVGVVAGPLIGTVFVKGPTFITGTVTLVKEVQMSGFALTLTYTESTGAQLFGALFSKPPSFIAGVVTPGNFTVNGVLFSRPPLFVAGQVNLRIFAAATFLKPPTFISGTITPTYDLVGVVFTVPPAFIAGTVTPIYTIVGNLFARPPTFPTGQINLTVSGVVFAAPPTFISGVVTPGGVTVTGVLFARPPTFISGQVNLTLLGVLFSKPPTFISGQVNMGLSGVLFSKPPSFPTGQINLRIFAGATFLKPPTFIAGVVDAGQRLDGVLFSRPPTFIAGNVLLDQTLDGVLFARPPSFISGVVTATYDLTGVLFSRPPSFISGQINLRVFAGATFLKPPAFIAGVVTPGGVQLDGVLFSRPPVFISGQVNLTLLGALFSRPPTFIAGTITTTYTISGVLFSKPPTFVSGQVNLTITGVLFSRPPTFISGVVSATYTISGVLFSRPPTFISGQVNLTLLGVVFLRPPSFIAGVITPGGVTLTGVVFTRPPLFISGTVVPSVNLYSTATGTIANVVDELDTTIDMHLSVDDDPATPTDTDWVNNTVLTASVFFDLTNVPADFTSADSATIIARYRGQEWGAGSLSLRAQLFQSNETTTMSDEVLVDTISANSAFGNSGTITLTGLDTGASKATWDLAKIRFRWS